LPILTSAPRLEASQIENACRGKLGPNDVPSEGGRSVLLTGPTRPTGSSATPPDSPPTSTSTAPSAPTPTPPASTFTPEQAEAGAKLLGSFADNISRDVGDGPFGGTNDLGFGVASLYSQRTSASPKAQQINAMGAHWAFSALAGGDKIFAAEIGASLDFVMGWSKLANNQDNGIVIFGTQPRFAFYAGPLGVGMRSNVDWMTTQVEGANAVSHFDFGPEVTLANNNSKRYRVSVSGFVMQPQWRSETWREDLTKNLFQSRTDRTSGFEARLTMQHITVTADIRLRDLRNLPGFPQLFNRQVYLGLGYRE
jgi:hypothetical protein